MQFESMTVLGLFDSSQKHFIIPVYQRAYSWDTEQWNTFSNDLKEQIKGQNNYFYGNLLLETVKKDVEYEIIDGQQRLTTLMIFIRSLIDVLKKRKVENIDLSSKERIYLKDGGNIKLRPVEYDRACFDTLIIEGKVKFETATPSQERIKKSKIHFYRELDKLTIGELLSIFDKIESTELTCIKLNGKKDSALMFELQNNRGKDLTNMEKLKSYFMYQLYVYSPADEVDTNIKSISKVFELIYLLINDLHSLNEDSVLIYHCNAYLRKGYNYRTIEDVKEEFTNSQDKVFWIKEFVGELHTSFSNIKKMESSQSSYLQDLRQLSIPAFPFPFIIKGYRYFGDDNCKLDSLFHLLEILVFRYRLINSRADIISRLNEILLQFDGNLEKLRRHLRNKLNESWYWGDHKMKENLNGYMYENSVLHYLLWKYEKFIQRKGYKIGSFKIDNEQIEHISPKKPTDGELIACGYEVDDENEYSDEFKEKHLNSIGNLMLISGSHNASIGNRPFSEKRQSYESNPLLRQQAEVKTFCNANNSALWDADCIRTRKIKIIDNFALAKWSFDNVIINEE